MSLLKAMLMGGADYVPKDMFKAVTYIGTGTERSITGLGFKPDLVWIKSRGDANPNALYDVVRGIQNTLVSNTTGAAATTASTLESYDEDGFTLGTNGSLNAIGQKYVAWCWKAGNTSGEANTQGSITSTVTAGKCMSIVKYTGTGANATVGHGLSSAPKMIYVKRIDAAGSWLVYNDSITATDYLVLNTTAAKASLTTIWNDTEPTSEVFSIGTQVEMNTNGGSYIAYCFTDVPGVSKIGSYTGTGAVGNAIDCGFQPAYVMVKRTDVAGAWVILDNKRDTHNPNTASLIANTTAAEVTTTYSVDFTSIGFTIQDTTAGLNASGGEYIFMAFAELPTKDSPENHNVPLFNMIASTGDGATDRKLDGLGFKPDLVFGKGRSFASSSYMFDPLRGVGYWLNSDTTSAHAFTAETLKAFMADGFRYGSNAGFNPAGGTNIAWCWNAGGEAVPNNDGSEDATVMANPTGGFSIVRFTHDGTTSTYGHGLGKAPKRIIVKRANGVSVHGVYDSTLGATKYLNLESAAAAVTHTPTWNDTEPTSDVFTVGTGWVAGEYIAYIWTDISEVSAFGSYTGTGVELSITGLGFKPDYVRVRRTDSVGNWLVFDSKRGATKFLISDNTGAEAVDAQTLKSFDSDGFTMGTNVNANANGSNNIWEAFKIYDNPNTLHQVETGDLLITAESEELGDEFAGDGVISNLGGGSITKVDDTHYTTTSDGTSGFTLRPKISFTVVSGIEYEVNIIETLNTGACDNVSFYGGGSYVLQNGTLGDNRDFRFTADGTDAWYAIDGTDTFSGSFVFSIKEVIPIPDVSDSTTKHDITLVGDVQASDSTKACGSHSILFDGTGDYLTVPSSSDFEFGSGDFTMDAWVYYSVASAYSTVISRDRTLTYEPFMFGYMDASGLLYFYASSNGSSSDIASAQPMGLQNLGNWMHLAVTRSGNIFRCYNNGIQTAEWSSSLAINTSTAELTTGYRVDNNGLITGNLDHIRMLKGTALWTTTNFNLTDKGLYYPSGTLQI